MSERLPNIHPGEILREEFLEPLGITPYRLAKEIRVTQSRIKEILDGKRSITADTALRLGRFFRMTPQFWLNLQAEYELRELRQNGLDLTTITPWPRSDRDQADEEKTEPAAA